MPRRPNPFGSGLLSAITNPGSALLGHLKFRAPKDTNKKTAVERKIKSLFWTKLADDALEGSWWQSLGGLTDEQQAAVPLTDLEKLFSRTVAGRAKKLEGETTKKGKVLKLKLPAKRLQNVGIALLSMKQSKERTGEGKNKGKNGGAVLPLVVAAKATAEMERDSNAKLEKLEEGEDGQQSSSSALPNDVPPMYEYRELHAELLRMDFEAWVNGGDSSGDSGAVQLFWSEEQVSVVKASIPTAEEVQLTHKFVTDAQGAPGQDEDGNVDARVALGLGEVGRFFVAMGKVPRLLQRLNLMQLRLSFDRRCKAISASASSVMAAADELMESASLKVSSTAASGDFDVDLCSLITNRLCRWHCSRCAL
jgi:hypothetical protein